MNDALTPAERTLDFTDFFERYAPIRNPFDPEAPIGGRLFRGYSREGTEKSYLESLNPHTLWTLCLDEDSSYIVAGVTRVDREGILVAHVARRSDGEAELIFVQEDEHEESDNPS